jgi:phosphonate transport system substrate-binding protein
MTGQILRFASFLSPALYPTYERIVEYVAHTTGIAATLETGEAIEDLLEGRLAGGFVCGLVYVHLARHARGSVELSAAPVLLGERYRGQAHYFSDIVIRRDSHFTNFADLAGCTWAYNEVASHSGYNLVYYNLVQRGLSPTYFGSWRASGSHARSLEMVVQGEADAAAIDSHVLAALLRDEPELREHIRSVGAFGPSAVPPIVVSTSLSADVRVAIRAALLRMGDEPDGARYLQDGCIERFVAVENKHYDDIRKMYDVVQADRRSMPRSA